MLVLVFARENRHSLIKLYNDASQRPHINGSGVGNAQNYLRSPIVAALNIGVHLFFLIAATANVNYFYSRFVFMLEQDVLGLQVTVDDAVFL
mgnify:CR=1 FL=1